MEVEFQKLRKDEHVLSQKVSLEVTKESSDGKTTAEKPHTTVEPQVHIKKKAREKGASERASSDEFGLFDSDFRLRSMMPPR